jgi:hypothetical protein
MPRRSSDSARAEPQTIVQAERARCEAEVAAGRAVRLGDEIYESTSLPGTTSRALDRVREHLVTYFTRAGGARTSPAPSRNYS